MKKCMVLWQLNSVIRMAVQEAASIPDKRFAEEIV